jgi:signal transduction histidine kinase
MKHDGGRASTATADRVRETVDTQTLVAQCPDGLAVIDARGRFLQANPAAVLLCGLDPSQVCGSASPFGGDAASAGSSDEKTEHIAVWEPAGSVRREFAFRAHPFGAHGERIVSFRDVSGTRRDQRRLNAIASAASSVAAKRSLSSTLEALAQEVLEADSLASVQILTVNSTGERFHVMGAAGFGRALNFFDRLLECRAAGAELRMIEAFTTRKPVVVPHRYEVIMTDSAWEPLREHLRHPEWDWFASVPLMARGEPVGILNAFFAPGQEIGATTLDFLLAMAEQAAQAVDFASLLEREREVARQEERQRLARELHDSVVQNVFSISMQAKSLSVLSSRHTPIEPATVVRVADELSDITQSVLEDLRGMVTELRPATSAKEGLAAAITDLADVTTSRTDLIVHASIEDAEREIDDLEPDLREDIYRVVAEAVHNSVKHSRGSMVQIRVGFTGEKASRWLVAEIVDDGCGLYGRAEPDGSSDEGGYGMTAMQERAARWSGSVRAQSCTEQGTAVELKIPLPVALPTRLEHWTAQS